jgi:hypothetical protein
MLGRTCRVRSSRLKGNVASLITLQSSESTRFFTLYEESQRSITIGHNPAAHTRAKQTDIRSHSLSVSRSSDAVAYTMTLHDIVPSTMTSLTHHDIGLIFPSAMESCTSLSQPEFDKVQDIFTPVSWRAPRLLLSGLDTLGNWIGMMTAALPLFVFQSTSTLCR